MNYKTPDVYVEEISLFPPSVAEVETAIPAFLGYTEKAEFKGKSLAKKPTEVTSLLEFEERFGGAPPLKVTDVLLNETNAVTNVETESTYYLYDSLRLYFANGGGRCYIVSVGTYLEDIEVSPLQDGLAEVKKEDEPTILVFPDAALLSADDLSTLQKDALGQADELGDRFAVLDVKEEGDDWKQNYKDFRNKIGINDLLYGAAYTPYLKCNLPQSVKFHQVYNKLKKYGVPVELASLTSEQEVVETIETLKEIVSDKGELTDAVGTIKGSAKSLNELHESKVSDFKSTVKVTPQSETNIRAKLKALISMCYDLVDEIYDDFGGGTVTLAGSGPDSLVEYIKARITAETDGIVEKLNSYVKDAGSAIGGTSISESMFTGLTINTSIWGTDRFDNSAVTADHDPYKGSTNIAKMIAAEPVFSGLAKQLIGGITDILAAMSSLENAKESLLTQQMPVYKNIISAVGSDLTVLPPSGAIAGVYCMVDRSRGVWKAPANVSLNNVVGVTERIDNKEQEDLNVDVNAGKSINAIRPFSGKGILVWGARTLAGNDNEWRYISVRRFFNMVEESVKKSTYWAVFEPNDANLWIKLKAMIENYLTLKWRQGALAGSTPEEAFFVNVGLAKTMSPQDILEGRLIIDIGMAAVRPAEFIILRFMHKMQES